MGAGREEKKNRRVEVGFFFRSFANEIFFSKLRKWTSSSAMFSAQQGTCFARTFRALMLFSAHRTAHRFPSKPKTRITTKTSKRHFRRVLDAPWHVPGVDLTDFFNYGHTIESWKEYQGLVYQFRESYGRQEAIATYDSAEQGDVQTAHAPQQYGHAPQMLPQFAVRKVLKIR